MANSRKTKEENVNKRRGNQTDACCDDSCCGGSPSVSFKSEGGGCC